MFLLYLIWLIVDVAYILGWIQQKYHVSTLVGNEKKYYCTVVVASVIMLSPSVIAESEYYTSALAAKTVISGEAKEYGTIFKENIEILKNSTEDTVTLYDIENEPELFASPEMEPWSNGLRLFYDKSEIHYITWEE